MALEALGTESERPLSRASCSSGGKEASPAAPVAELVGAGEELGRTVAAESSLKSIATLPFRLSVSIDVAFEAREPTVLPQAIRGGELML